MPLFGSPLAQFENMAVLVAVMRRTDKRCPVPILGHPVEERQECCGSVLVVTPQQHDINGFQHLKRIGKGLTGRQDNPRGNGLLMTRATMHQACRFGNRMQLGASALLHYYRVTALQKAPEA